MSYQGAFFKYIAVNYRRISKELSTLGREVVIKEKTHNT